ncbi:alpha-L-fucosidase [Hymenobacter humi]|uniref:Alpha-L-fucosidase n=1 Tax=Hymenobacter humi TaxID=1411620 RepID=A0ABW2U8U0_9BACT
MFNPQNLDVDTWMRKLKDLGFQYAILTIQEEYGFEIFPHPVPRNFAPVNMASGPNGSNFVSPRYPDGPYNVRPGTADNNILDKFLAACKKYGIAPGFYMNEIGNIEVFNGQFNYNNNALASHPRYDEWIDYQCRLIQYVLMRWPVPILWMDKGTGSTAKMSQATYNAAKAINPKVVIIGNHAGENEFSSERFPYDVGSTEQYALPPFGNNTAYLSTTRNYGGQSYYVGQEFVLTPYSTPAGHQWYNYDELCPLQWPSPPRPPLLTPSAPADFQATVNLGKQAQRPILVDIIIDRYGTIVQQTLDYMAQINFAR